MWSALLHDRLVRVLAAGSVLAALFHVLSGVAPAHWTGPGELVVKLPFLALAMYAFCVAPPGGAAAAQGFRRWMAGAFACWLALRIVALAFGEEVEGGLALRLLQDSLYGGFYLCAAFALEESPSPPPGAAARRGGGRTLSFASLALFVVGSLVYFTVLPGALHPSAAGSGPSSPFFAVVLGLYLVLRCAVLLGAAGRSAWRAIAALLVFAFAAWGLLDLHEALRHAAALPRAVPSDALELAWLAPLAATVLAARLPLSLPPVEGARHRAPTATEAATEAAGRSAGTPPALVLVILLPSMHVTLHAWGALEGSLRPAREALVLVLLASLGMLALLHHRLLQHQNAGLERERRRVARQARLTQHMEAIARLAGGIAHEFNNSLQVIRGSSDLLLDELPRRDPRRSRALEIRAAAEHARRLSDRLLSFSQSRPREPELVDANELIANLRLLLERLVGEDVELHVAGEAVPLVRVDRSQLEQALLSLAANARDAMPDGGSLVLETRAISVADRAPGGLLGPGEWTAITMRDSGIGMGEETKERIFEPFFTTKEEGAGTGLGLAAVYRFVREAGGHVDVESEKGRGATFHLCLPAQGHRRLRSRPPRSEPRLLPGRHPGGFRGETILLVEDDDAVRRTIQRLLQQNGWQTVAVRSGAEALKLYQGSAPPDLLLSDVRMPGMSGFELAERVRDLLPDAAILLMTGHPGTEPEPATGRAPMLEKPFSREQLERRVSEVLAARTRAST